MLTGPKGMNVIETVSRKGGGLFLFQKNNFLSYCSNWLTLIKSNDGLCSPM